MTDTQPMAPVDADALAKIAELAKNTIPGAAEASVTLVSGTGARSAAYTGKLALELDEWQYEHGHGPCLDASRSHETLSVPDMSAETRWPDWAACALDAGSRSSLSIGLPSRERVTGALNVYATGTRAFDDDAITVARVFADYAAVVVSDDRRHHEAEITVARHLQTAMDRRAVIEQAKGIIMGDRHCTAAAAAAILDQLSQYTNRKPADIAAALVGRVPENR